MGFIELALIMLWMGPGPMWLVPCACRDGCHAPVMKPSRLLARTMGLLGPEGSYLVDPASSHMLVSKIKPCMSKYKQLYGETANGSLNQL